MNKMQETKKGEFSLPNSDDEEDYEEDNFEDSANSSGGKEIEKSPRIEKDNENEKNHYEQLDESNNLAEKQNENDPLKEFYEMRKT